MSREKKIAKLKIVLTKTSIRSKLLSKPLKSSSTDKIIKKREERYIKLLYLSQKCEEFAFRLKNLIETNLILIKKLETGTILQIVKFFM